MTHEDAYGPRDIGYDQVNALLLERLPGLRARYVELEQLYGSEEPGPHIVYGDVLTPFIVETLRMDSPNPSLATAFALLEELLSSGNPDIRDLVGASVLEPLYADASSRERAPKLMGAHTKRLAARIGNAWS